MLQVSQAATSSSLSAATVANAAWNPFAWEMPLGLALTPKASRSAECGSTRGRRAWRRSVGFVPFKREERDRSGACRPTERAELTEERTRLCGCSPTAGEKAPSWAAEAAVATVAQRQIPDRKTALDSIPKIAEQSAIDIDEIQ
jgi:hypothetical protein